MEETVSKEVWEERSRAMEERFMRGRERLNKMDEQVEKISALTIQMGEILKQNNEKLSNHDKRIVALESRPSKWFDRILSGLVGALATGIGAAAAALLFR